ncbi:MAG: helix-turn-helix transcriptional regulator [Ignavibacteriae bacterium]|nr:helix-turn-helix transcriptional regulator [Ignavibacteriota bacterium]MCB9217181.1 helix-turn-helix transcriptional regulator [Ignavibacteria bacterium]
MTIGERLKFYAKTRHRSVRNFAKVCDIHPSQMSKYVNNVNEPSISALEKIRAAGVSIDWLISGNGSMDVQHTDLTMDTASPIGMYLGEKTLSDVFDLNDPNLSDHIVWMESALHSLKDLVKRGAILSDEKKK